MITTNVLSFDLKCRCGRGAKVTADTVEIALATYRQNGWVASTSSLRLFYTKLKAGIEELPIMRCSVSCWVEGEMYYSVMDFEVVRRAVKRCREADLADDVMQMHGFWLCQTTPVKDLAEAIKAARPGTTERRLRRRRIVR